MHSSDNGQDKPAALALLSSERPRNVTWRQAAGLLFGDWGTSRLYVLGLAFLFAGRTSFYLILAMSLLIVAVGWAYTQICRIYPDGGGVYTAAKHRSRMLAVVGALLLFADYTVTASLSALDAFHYFGLPMKRQVAQERPAEASLAPSPTVDAGGDIVLEHEDAFEQKLAALPGGIQLPPETKTNKFWYSPDEHRLKFVGHMSRQQLTDYSTLSTDPSWRTAVEELYSQSQPERLLAIDSPGLWAIIAIGLIGLFNLMGPKHTGGFALVAAVGMVLITLLIACCAHPQISLKNVQFGTLHHRPGDMWIAFVSIVLALSGVEAIANLTGVMKKPVAHTARKAIWVVTAEVAVFNVLLALCMLAIFPLDRAEHYQDMLAYLSGHYTNAFLHGAGEWMVRIVGGLLLLSAANTAIMDMISVQYLMARDGELPAVHAGTQSLWRAVDAGRCCRQCPDPCPGHQPRSGKPGRPLRHRRDRRGGDQRHAVRAPSAPPPDAPQGADDDPGHRPAGHLGDTGLHEAPRAVVRHRRYGGGPHRPPDQQADVDAQRPQTESAAPGHRRAIDARGIRAKKLLIGTYGSDSLAMAGMWLAKEEEATLVVCFIREVNLSFKYGNQKTLSIDTDLAAQRTFARFLELAHQLKVPIIPVYDTGPDAGELLAENAAIYACERLLIGTSRQGVIYHFVKGHFQRRLEALLPPDIPVQVITEEMAPPEAHAMAAVPPREGH